MRVPKLYREADVFRSCSRYKASFRALLELTGLGEQKIMSLRVAFATFSGGRVVLRLRAAELSGSRRVPKLFSIQSLFQGFTRTDRGRWIKNNVTSSGFCDLSGGKVVSRSMGVPRLYREAGVFRSCSRYIASFRASLELTRVGEQKNNVTSSGFYDLFGRKSCMEKHGCSEVVSRSRRVPKLFSIQSLFQGFTRTDRAR